MEGVEYWVILEENLKVGQRVIFQQNNDPKRTVKAYWTA